MPHFRLIYPFWQTYSPKTVSIEDVIFWNCDFEHFYTSHSKKGTFLEYWDQTGSETHCLRKNANMTLCDPGLTWPFVVDLHGVRFQNGFDFWILRAKVTMKHVPHFRNRIFDSGDLSWPFVTLPWHWPVQYGTYANRVSSLALWGYFRFVSSKNYRHCRP